VTIANAASPPATLLALLISISIGMALLLPSLWFLFHVFRGKNPGLLVEKMREYQ
jgi:cytochrome bd-type quinol oxidase subunit 2